MKNKCGQDQVTKELLSIFFHHPHPALVPLIIHHPPLLLISPSLSFLPHYPSTCPSICLPLSPSSYYPSTSPSTCASFSILSFSYYTPPSPSTSPSFSVFPSSYYHSTPVTNKCVQVPKSVPAGDMLGNKS